MTTSRNALSMQPNWRFILSHPAHFLAFGFGSGLMRKAPGTWGTLAAYPLFFILFLFGVQGWYLAALCLPLFVLGVWICDHTGRILGVADYGGIVWDEIVAMLLILAFTPATPVAWLVAFLLFRLFDIAKPWPIRWVDRRVAGGLGVMLDDLLAAGFVLLVQFIWAYGRGISA